MFTGSASVPGADHTKADSIPVIGSSGSLSSYVDAFRFLLDGEAIIQKGYVKYRGLIFRVPLLGRWNYVASGEILISDIGHAPEDVLSFDDAIREVCVWVLSAPACPLYLIYNLATSIGYDYRSRAQG